MRIDRMVAMALEFQYHSERAQSARLGMSLTPQIGMGLAVIGLLLGVLGTALVIVGSVAGWVLAGIGCFIVCVGEWVQYGLHRIAPQTGDRLDLMLESGVLAHLPEKYSPQDLATAAMRVQSGQFFAARFGIAPSFLHDLSSSRIEDGEAVISSAREFMKLSESNELTGSMIVAALCYTQSQLEQMLPHLQIEKADLGSGVAWYSRLQQLIDDGKRPKRTGGIARDWSFGYANTLKRFGTNVSDRVAHGGTLHVRLDSHASALRHIQETFSHPGRQNVTLIGPVGAGKSTIVYAFAESLLESSDDISPQLRFQQVVSLDASAIISSVRSRNELEQLVNRLLIEAYHAKNIILCLDDAQLFLEDQPGSVDLSSILLPVLEGGALRLLLTMDDQRYLQIAQRNPSLASALNRVNIPPASESESLRVMQDQLIMTEFQRKVTYMYQALKEAYRLSERYTYELAQPGKSVRLLEQAASYADNGFVTAASVKRAIEETRGVKVGRADSADERDALLHLEDRIHERMINQTRAVSVVSDALRRARAGVRNESRPIGTFLFLGPTGVGKTELSKALADAFFGGEDRLVRLDLNEFVRASDVSRLLADGASDPRSLTAQIMKQPFSVVLLDEIEKAHPMVLNTLLQMLDEGVLRDINNVEVSFRDAIVITTSNAGADTIRQLLAAGYQLEAVEKQFIEKLIETRQFRPEFLNRFDEIVLFRPLNEDELCQVVNLMIAGVNKTLRPQQVSVTLDAAAVKKLAQVGGDPKFGARPMRRAVQRTVENLIAKKLLDGSAQPGDVIVVTENDITS